MTKPRPIIEGTTYLLTRRCAQRQFLLQPCAAVAQTFTYCLGVAQRRYGLLIHGVCVMANHYHLVATDPGARLPEFMHWMNEFVAKNLNVHWGRSESFWAPGSYSAVKLADYEAVVEKTAYTLLNPVAAGLVPKSGQWPGLVSRPEDIEGGVWCAKRPRLYFGRRSRLREEEEVVFSPLPGCDAGQFARDVREALLLGERALGRQKKGSFKGRETVLAQSHLSRPTSDEEPKRLKPRVATRDRALRRAELSQLREFEATYKEAWLRRQATEDELILFPEGTYLVARTDKRVRCQR